MRKKSVYVWSLVAALMMTACSDQNEAIDTGNGKTSSLEFAVDFGEIAKSRAATNAIPVTSWAKSIKEVQFFLYDASGIVKYSAKVDPAAKTGDTKSYVYTDVPVGDYTLVAVANVHSSTNPIATNEPSLGAAEWNASNVRQKPVSGFTISHKAGAFPTYSSSGVVPAGISAFETPSEIFMAAHTSTVSVTSGGTTNITSTPLQLKREVSLMRVRLNVDDPESGTENATTVDWTSDVSVLIYNLPNNMKIEDGNAGGTAAVSTGINVQVGALAFSTTAPAAADYSNPSTMISGNFKRWADIVVFPNNGGRVGNKPTPGDADKATVAQKYTIVVTAKGKQGHVLANGNALMADKTIYWDGLIDEAFFPNFIREVNLTLKSGGKDGEIPTGPIEKGELQISVSAPAKWDDNILESTLEL